MAMSNVLYLTVLPLIRISKGAFTDAFSNAFARIGVPGGYGTGQNIPDPVEQFFTLFPDRNLATEFFPNEVDRYVNEFLAAANQYLRGGHVTGYEVEKLPTEDGRVVVRVTQNVRE